MELCWEQGFRSVEVQSRQGRESITGWQTCLPLLAGHAGLVSAKKLFLTGAERFFFSVRSKHEPAHVVARCRVVCLMESQSQKLGKSFVKSS